MAETENIVPRIENAPEFARKNRVLLLKHEPTQTEIDISLGILPFEYEMVERSHEVDVAGVFKLRLPTPEDLIIMKAIAHRPKDLEDIRNIVEKQKKLDRRRIRQWVTDFADALDNPAIWTEIRNLIEKA